MTAQRIAIIASDPEVAAEMANDIARERPGMTVRDTLSMGKMPWSWQSRELAGWLEQVGPWIVTGAGSIVARGLRKFCEKLHALEAPCDLVIWVREEKPTGNALAIQTITNGILDELRARGVTIVSPVGDGQFAILRPRATPTILPPAVESEPVVVAASRPITGVDCVYRSVASEPPPRPQYEPSRPVAQGETVRCGHASVRCWPEGTR